MIRGTDTFDRSLGGLFLSTPTHSKKVFALLIMIFKITLIGAMEGFADISCEMRVGEGDVERPIRLFVDIHDAL